MPIRWNPAVVLNFDPDDTCMGNTLKGARCQNCVNKSDRSRASKLLAEMAQYRPGSDTVVEILDGLAPLTLCLRWHRDGRRSQTQDVREKWDEAIEDYLLSRPTTKRRSTARGETHAREKSDEAIGNYLSSRPTTKRRSTARGETHARERNTRDAGHDNSTTATRRVRSAPSVLAMATRPTSPSSSRSEVLAEIIQLRDELESLAARYASEDAQRASQQARYASQQAQDASQDASQDNQLASQQAQDAFQDTQQASQQASPQASQQAGLPASPPSSPSRSRADAATLQAVREFLLQASPFDPRPTNLASRSMPRPRPLHAPSSSRMPTPRHTLARSVPRRPITVDCAICYESMASVDETVWCQAQCGQSVHRECLEQWRDQSTTTREAEDRGVRPRPLRCVHCRAVWREE